MIKGQGALLDKRGHPIDRLFVQDMRLLLPNWLGIKDKDKIIKADKCFLYPLDGSTNVYTDDTEPSQVTKKGTYVGSMSTSKKRKWDKFSASNPEHRTLTQEQEIKKLKIDPLDQLKWMQSKKALDDARLETEKVT